MIMRPGQAQLLLPVSPLFIGFSLVLALLVNMLPLGRTAWVPDLLALVLVFWSVHQPARVGLGAAFVFGLIMDVHQSALLGQHSLSYATLSFCAIMVHRRLLWYTVPSQALQLVPLFAAVHLIELAIRMIAGGAFPGWTMLVAPLVVNEVEAAALAGVAVDTPQDAAAAAQALRGRGPAQVVVTLGAAGAVAADADGCRHHPGMRVRAVDTTAAGDTFLGALAVALARGEPLDAGVREGIRAAALCVTQHGAQPSIPTRAAVAQSPQPPDWTAL